MGNTYKEQRKWNDESNPNSNWKKEREGKRKDKMSRIIGITPNNKSKTNHRTHTISDFGSDN